MVTSKKALIQEIITTTSHILKIPLCKITYLRMPDEYGKVVCLFSKDNYQININEDAIKKLSDLEITAAMIHETRHAYQWFQIIHPEKATETEEQIMVWQQEFAHYIQPIHDEELFLNQHLEIDAVAFTAIVTKLLFRQDLIIPEIVKEKVYARINQMQKQYEYLRTV
ncbi:MAG TPA: hypothetical protein PLW60_01155 [Bacilli bacterium]|nr:MAG: hypothetical protein BWY97_00567 [Tenericutes bacterium ADurb.BinA124]HNZ50107.1 hypothetical protein [Bacilli bacterium]HPX84021.1 hypothetical protein [Bacilli bacterium]HQC74121.1 hypothetical protein [Bacilli bacterium]